jgi:hypothetical protein
MSTTRTPQTRPIVAPAQRRWRQVEAEPPPPYTQGALALTYPLPAGLDAEPRSTALTLVNGEPADDQQLPDAEQWAARFVQAVIEVVSSDRPLSQLARWTAPAVYTDLGRRRERVVQHRRTGQVRASRQHVATVHVSQPASDCAEVAARVTAGRRSRAVAARLEFVRGRWLCTALDFG